MSILKIAKLGHPILLKKTSKVEDFNDHSIKKLIYDMSETMLDAKGIGLAAPQVHVSKKIIIFRIPEEIENENNEININVLINPKIELISDETDNKWEGCLSIPGMLGLVKRHSKISYEGFDIAGNLIKKTAEGMHARVIQHEFDHLNGIVYTQRLADNKAYGYEEEIEEYWKKKHE